MFTKDDQNCSGSTFFVVTSAGPQKVVSRLDGTQNFASRADRKLGFEGKVPKVREGCARQGSAARGESDRMNPIVYHIYVRTPHAGGMFGEQCTYNTQHRKGR